MTASLSFYSDAYAETPMVDAQQDQHCFLPAAGQEGVPCLSMWAKKTAWSTCVATGVHSGVLVEDPDEEHQPFAPSDCPLWICNLQRPAGHSGSAMIYYAFDIP